MLANIFFYAFSSHELHYFSKEVNRILTLQKRFFPKNLSKREIYSWSEYKPKWPHIEWIIIVSVIEKELGCFEISSTNLGVILFSWKIVLCQSPINNFNNEMLLLFLNKYILWFYISMENAFGMSLLYSLN